MLTVLNESLMCEEDRRKCGSPRTGDGRDLNLETLCSRSARGSYTSVSFASILATQLLPLSAQKSREIGFQPLSMVVGTKEISCPFETYLSEIDLYFPPFLPARVSLPSFFFSLLTSQAG